MATRSAVKSGLNRQSFFGEPHAGSANNRNGRKRAASCGNVVQYKCKATQFCCLLLLLMLCCFRIVGEQPMQQQVVNFRAPPDLAAFLKATAARESVSLSDLLRRLVTQAVAPTGDGSPRTPRPRDPGERELAAA